MADVITKKQRRLNMNRVRGRDTKPEMIIRRGLHAKGLRFRLHRQDLPGRPDLVLPRHRTIILVHGCFWQWFPKPPAARSVFVPSSRHRLPDAQQAREQQSRVNAALTLMHTTITAASPRYSSLPAPDSIRTIGVRKIRLVGHFARITTNPVRPDT